LFTRILALLIVLTAIMQATGQDQPNVKDVQRHALHGTPQADFDSLVDRYFDFYFHHNPTAGTAAGFHQYDRAFEDLSRSAIDATVRGLKQLNTEFAAVNPAKLDAERASDHALVVAAINSELLSLEDIRQWEKNPDVYSSGMTNSAFVIMARKFAPAAERLASLTARERLMPKMLDAARTNLKSPPRVYTEVAIEQLPGIIGFFQNDVPAAFKDVHDAKLLADFKSANDAVIHALQDYETWLKQDLLPRSNGDFRIGAENYRKKLLYDEMVDIPLDRLLQIGMDDLHRNQQEFERIAKLIDPNRTPQEILEELEKDHPSADQLLPTFRSVLGGIRQFIVDHHIVTIPSPVPPIVEETPPFMRALTFASMDTPGPYEHVAKEAFFNVTVPEPNWPQKQVEEWLQGFNRGTIISTAIHEVYPGHYVQFLWVPRAPSKVRKLIGCGSNAEGWAHYTEQMMLDEGYGRTPGVPEEKDLKFLKLRIGQLQDALLRDARYIVGIRMHTGQMSFDEGVKFFETEGMQTHAVSERETKRGTSDPTYLVYTLGKLEIMKLRADMKKKLGAGFNLERFHDNFLQQGFPPVKIIREQMLGDTSPVL
jgi:uncharacterized protein (DUF885 family)